MVIPAQKYELVFSNNYFLFFEFLPVGKYASSSEVLSYPASTCPNRGLGIVSYAEIERGVKNILERKVKRKTKLYLV